ncbi:MAG: four helix bundle protein [Candidatus Brocadiia bacterium]
MGAVRSFRDLRVYQELRRLHLELHDESLRFPRFELYELGSQLRRASNSAAAQLAEGYASRHTNVYIEAITRAQAELQETRHHIDVAHQKRYLSQARFRELDRRYHTCARMLERLYQSLSRWRGSMRTPDRVHEDDPKYGLTNAAHWQTATEITDRVMGQFDLAPPGDTAGPENPDFADPQPGT